jgi:NAD(P)-dependent dehydrogenase (short-subunit alcohol dehydrogenase family)
MPFHDSAGREQPEPMASTTDSKIILITGANKGIGFATARHLGRAGHTVLLGARDPHRGETAAATLVQDGLDARYLHLDVTDPTTVDDAALYIADEFGHLDALINNAAITGDRGRPPSGLPTGVLREIYETNVLGVVTTTNTMLPLLRRAAAGRIANVSSGLGTIAILADPDSPLRDYARLLGYNSSKAALNAITLVYAAELTGTTITVNAVSPGFCATDLNNHTGVLTADEGGAHIAHQIDFSPASPHGVFLSDQGGTYPW